MPSQSSINDPLATSIPLLRVSPTGEGHWSTDTSLNVSDENWRDGLSAEKIVIFDSLQWLSQREIGTDDVVLYGLRLSGDEDLESIADELEHFSLIIIEFPHFTDGRGFSLAAQLRERYQYRGSLRASGYLLVDQLSYLLRCGFDSFVFSNEVDADYALEGLSGFSVAYQPSTSG